MVPSALIYMSSGKQHSKIRRLLGRSLHGLGREDANFNDELLPEPDSLVDDGLVNANLTSVRRSLVRNMWKRLFKKTPSQSTEDNLLAYYSYGGVSGGCTMRGTGKRREDCRALHLDSPHAPRPVS